MQHPCLHVHMVSRLQIYLKFVLALKSNTFLCFTFKGLEFADGMFVHSGLGSFQSLSFEKAVFGEAKLWFPPVLFQSKVTWTLNQTL